MRFLKTSNSSLKTSFPSLIKAVLSLPIHRGRKGHFNPFSKTCASQIYLPFWNKVFYILKLVRKFKFCTWMTTKTTHLCNSICKVVCTAITWKTYLLIFQILVYVNFKLSQHLWVPCLLMKQILLHPSDVIKKQNKMAS